MPDLIALVVPAGPQFVDLIQETWDGGDAFAPVDARLPPAQQQNLLKSLAPTEVLYRDTDGRLQRHRPDFGQEVAEGDALVLATSGTSGHPKAVVHTHESIMASAQATSKALHVDPAADKWLACLPVAHIGGLSVILRALVTNTAVEVHDGFDAATVIEAAEQRGVTLVSLVTRALNQVPAQLFRTVLIGGAAPPADLPVNVIPTYGMTETGSGVVYGSQILEGCEIGILDHDGHPIDEAEVSGVIAIKGPMLFRGYRSADGTIERPFTNEGWFLTGDLGRWRTDRSLAVEGREGDVIVTGGENVWPTPIEQLLTSRHDVAEAAVIGRPDPEWGHRVVAVVVPADISAVPTLDELRETVTEKLPRWCAPKELVIRNQPLPRTSLGKLRRSAVSLP